MNDSFIVLAVCILLYAAMYGLDAYERDRQQARYTATIEDEQQ